MIFGTVILLLSAAWHSLAAYHFLFYPARTLARATKERPVNTIASQVVLFLGGLNVAFVVLAVAGSMASFGGRRLAFLVLMVANLSQALIDLRVHRSGLASGNFFMQICVGDVLFTALNAAGLALS